MPRQPAAPLNLASFPLMLAKRGVLPHGDDWHYELKYDGYRMLALTAEPALRVRGGGDATSWFPDLHGPLAALPAGCVIDAEAVVLDDIGRANFNALHERAQRKRWYRGAPTVALAAFDLLVLRGQDIRDWPIERRKAALADLLHGVTVGLLYVQAVDDGEWLWQQVLGLGLEGIVAKRAGSLYRGVSDDWRKIKRPGAIQPGRFRRAI
jgi:bifunctional non-homologous end joining protein LigD